ncbi:hypothetical protein MNBD_GAMMA23-262 [hydrothermal vent metagenome]|uniref:Integral membrane protein n=1 Tax=hydrothermal vent metagenome TaxID=652676 RepID=A0A3B0ZVV4_9ZZZZ
MVLFAEPAKVFAAFAKMSILSWLLILSCSFSNYLLRFARWHYYLRYLKYPIPLTQNFLYYMAGFALTLTPAKIGETIRSTYLAQHAVPYTRSLAVFFAERFLDVVVIALLSLFVLQFENASHNYHYFVIASAVIVVSFIPLLRQTFVTQFVSTVAKKIPWQAIRALLQHLIHLLTTARALFAYKPIYSGLVLGSIAWLIQGLAFYFILTTLNIDITLQQSIGIYAISLLAGAVSFIPGGIGTTEAVMTLLLTFLGADTATAIAAALISRLSTLWFAVGLGFGAALVLSFKKQLKLE